MSCSTFITPPSLAHTIGREWLLHHLSTMTYNPRNSSDAPGTTPDRGMNARNFVLIIAVTVIVLLGVILTFALRSNTSGSSTKPIDAAPAKSSGPSPQ